MDDSVIYSDRLVEIDDDSLLLRDYYFPSGKSRRVNFKEMEGITVVKPTLWNGKYRIWGSGGRSWFPQDGYRPSRDKIFIIKLRQKKRSFFARLLPTPCPSIGFTVEDSQTVAAILRTKCAFADES